MEERNQGPTYRDLAVAWNAHPEGEALAQLLSERDAIGRRTWQTVVQRTDATRVVYQLQPVNRRDLRPAVVIAVFPRITDDARAAAAAAQHAADASSAGS